MEFAYALSGLVVGFIVGMTGVGGGALMTPLLVLGFGVSPATAVGTDLLYAALTKAGGLAVHARRGSVDWTVTARLAAGSVPAALVTLAILHGLGVSSQAAGRTITLTLGVALLATAATLLFKGQIRALAARLGTRASPTRSALATVAVGATIGALVTLSSVGAGALGAAALLLLYPALPAVRVVGTDIAHAIPLALVAGLGHAGLGTVDFGLLANLLAGSLPGILAGSLCAGRVPERALRTVLAAMLALVGCRLVC